MCRTTTALDGLHKLAAIDKPAADVVSFGFAGLPLPEVAKF
jgi:hypothetical protein